MQSQLESFLAKFYTDADFRERFSQDPEALLRSEGFDPALTERFLRGDLVGLELAAESFSRKRAKSKAGIFQRLSRPFKKYL